MNWCFAIVNKKLSEIFFEPKKNGDLKILGHAYVKESEYKTKKEKKWIESDIQKLSFMYKKGVYKKLEKI